MEWMRFLFFKKSFNLCIHSIKKHKCKFIFIKITENR